VAAESPDILCVQEIKADVWDVPIEAAAALGYTTYCFSAEKKGYSGVALFTRRIPDLVENGCGLPGYDGEGRILRADFGPWTLLNCYFPSGTTGQARQDVKMAFLRDFGQWVEALRRTRPFLIVTGDYNIAHTPIDLHDPKGNKKNSGFLPEERAWMTAWFESGFVDAFRHLHPETVAYSWWTTRFNARANNKGWRLDYFSVTASKAAAIADCYYMPDAMHSDHCPVRLLLQEEGSLLHAAE
jgi:exodeoxyribonuclease-3